MPLATGPNPWRREGLLVLIRLAVGTSLLWSGLLKTRQPFVFLGAIYGYHLLGPKLSLLVAVCLPWVELAIAVCLLGEIFLEGALVLTSLCGAVFTMAVGTALLRGLQISCGCFVSADDTRISYLTLIRASAVMAAGVIGLVLVSRRATGRHAEPTSEPARLAVA